MAATIDPATAPSLDLDRLRADFPILEREVNGHRLVYLDSSAPLLKENRATSLIKGKPQPGCCWADWGKAF